MDDGGEAAHVVTARELVDRASVILLDFDGPVCSVFAGVPASAIAERMQRGLASMSALLGDRAERDPLQVLLAARRLSAEAGKMAEAVLAEAELEAIVTAEPTAGTAAFLVATRDLGKSVAIVSNNSEAAIREYLRIQGLDEFVEYVSARDPEDARTMKPHPRAVHSALLALNQPPGQAILIGDSTSDVAAAQSAFVSCIGYANRPHKVRTLQAAGARVVVTEMRELL